MSKQQFREKPLSEKAKELGMTLAQFLRSPAITRWYGVKPKEDEPPEDKR